MKAITLFLLPSLFSSVAWTKADLSPHYAGPLMNSDLDKSSSTHANQQQDQQDAHQVDKKLLLNSPRYQDIRLHQESLSVLENSGGNTSSGGSHIATLSENTDNVSNDPAFTSSPTREKAAHSSSYEASAADQFNSSSLPPEENQSDGSAEASATESHSGGKGLSSNVQHEFPGETAEQPHAGEWKDVPGETAGQPYAVHDEAGGDSKVSEDAGADSRSQHGEEERIDPGDIFPPEQSGADQQHPFTGSGEAASSQDRDPGRYREAKKYSNVGHYGGAGRDRGRALRGQHPVGSSS